MTKRMIAAGAVLALWPVAAEAAAPLEPGLWETIVKTSGVMGMGANTFVNKECLRAEDAVKPENFTPDLVMPEMQCTKGNFTERGDTFTWDVVCRGPGVSMAGVGTFLAKGSQAYAGSVIMQMKVDGMPQIGGMGVETTTTYSGRRIGACTE